jgi:hypothetical protein
MLVQTAYIDLVFLKTLGKCNQILERSAGVKRDAIPPQDIDRSGDTQNVFQTWAVSLGTGQCTFVERSGGNTGIHQNRAMQVEILIVGRHPLIAQEDRLLMCDVRLCVSHNSLRL